MLKMFSALCEFQF